MRKDILALAIVKKGGGGGQLDDGLYNVENGNATNLVNKVAMSAANGKMFASGDRSTTNGIMYYLTTNPYEIKNIQGPELGDGKIYYLWGASDQGIIKREYVQPRKYYYVDPNGNTMLTEIPTPVTPSGSLSITQNGTYDVRTFANARVRVDTIAQVNDSSDFRVLRKLDKINFSDPEYRTYAVISSGDDEIEEDFFIAWREYENNFSFKYLRGGYDSIENFTQNRCIILSAILIDTETFNEQHRFSITLNGTYTEYSGSYTIEELQTMWEEAFQGVLVYDLTGRIVGYVGNCYAIIETRSDS